MDAAPASGNTLVAVISSRGKPPTVNGITSDRRHLGAGGTINQRQRQHDGNLVRTRGSGAGTVVTIATAQVVAPES